MEQSINDELMDNFVEVIMSIANLDFSKKAISNKNNPTYDAVACGLNMLTEELEDSVVTKKELQESEERLHQFMETLPVGVYILASDKEVFYVNQHAKNILLQPAPSVSPSNHNDTEKTMAIKATPPPLKLELFKASSGSCYPKNANPLNKAFKGEKNVRIEDAILKVGFQTIPIELVANPIFNQQGEIEFVIAAFSDITERKDREQELEKFGYVVSHDLKSPLKTVGQYISLLKKHHIAADNAEANEWIDFTNLTINRMTKFIDELLAYSKVGVQGINFSSIDLAGVLEIVMNNLQQQIKENNASIHIPQLPTITANSFQMIQLFQNLIGNALKFRGTANPDICIGYKEEKKYHYFIIKDNGIGIAPENQDKIFTLFQRINMREKFEGTGIGLATCKKIIELHGGNITVSSALNEGTTFHFKIAKKLSIIPKSAAPPNEALNFYPNKPGLPKNKKKGEEEK